MNLAQAGSPLPDDSRVLDRLHRHWWVAALLSLSAVGLGQIYVGRLRAAAVFLLIWLVVLLLLGSTLLGSFTGFVAVFALGIGVQIATVAHGVVSAWRDPTVERQPWHRWFVYPIYALSIFAIWLGFMAGTFSGIGIKPLGARFRPYSAPSASMQPNLRPGEYFMAEVFVASPQAADGHVGEAVVYKSPVDQRTYIHRMIAKSGDRISVGEKDVVINGQALAQRTCAP